MKEILDDKELLLIDAHCHLSSQPDELKENENIIPILEKFSKNKTNLILNVMTTTHKDHEILKNNNVFSNNHYSNIKFGVGIHPWYCYRYSLNSDMTKLTHYQNILTIDSDTEEQNTFNELIAKNIEKFPSVINLETYYNDAVISCYDFIGEVGLDFSANLIEISDILNIRNVKVSPKHQMDILKFFIEKASLHNFVLSIHSVNARLDTYKILKEYDEAISKDLKIVFHSYTGTIEQFEQQYLKLKHIKTFISLSGYINLKQPLTKKMNKLIQKIDTTKILLETDVPINTDRGFDFRSDLAKSLKVIAELKNIDYLMLNKQINENYNNIFS